jgi:hypothetical protein
MAWVDSLTGKLIALDTAPLIYFIEEHPIYMPVIEPFFRSLDAGRFQVITSTLTLHRPNRAASGGTPSSAKHDNSRRTANCNGA